MVDADLVPGGMRQGKILTNFSLSLKVRRAYFAVRLLHFSRAVLGDVLPLLLQVCMPSYNRQLHHAIMSDAVTTSSTACPGGALAARYSGKPGALLSSTLSVLLAMLTEMLCLPGWLSSARRAQRCSWTRCGKT